MYKSFLFCSLFKIQRLIKNFVNNFSLFFFSDFSGPGWTSMVNQLLCVNVYITYGIVIIIVNFYKNSNVFTYTNQWSNSGGDYYFNGSSPSHSLSLLVISRFLFSFHQFLMNFLISFSVNLNIYILFLKKINKLFYLMFLYLLF